MKDSAPAWYSLGLFQKLSSGGAHFFFRPLHPQDIHGVRAPRPLGHVSALKLIRPTMDQICLDSPRTSYPSTPTPRTHCQQSTLPPPDKKVSAAHPPPEDNFWNSPYLKGFCSSLIQLQACCIQEINLFQTANHGKQLKSLCHYNVAQRHMIILKAGLGLDTAKIIVVCQHQLQFPTGCSLYYMHRLHQMIFLENSLN